MKSSINSLIESWKKINPFRKAENEKWNNLTDEKRDERSQERFERFLFFSGNAALVAFAIFLHHYEETHPEPLEKVECVNMTQQTQTASAAPALKR